jgi:DnaJ-class molecular chaperone
MISADESDAEAAERAHCIPCDGHGFIGTDKTPCAPCDGTGFRFPSKRAPDRAACIPPVARR